MPVLATLLATTIGAGMARAASSRDLPTSARSSPSARASQTGMASWHEVTESPGGACTASSHRWKNSELVAAHRTLPLGSTVRVIDVATGRSVVVEITDRGPYARGRIIDLSVAAAIRLGMISAGVARVRVEPVPGLVGTPGKMPTPVEKLVATAMAPLQGWSFPAR